MAKLKHLKEEHQHMKPEDTSKQTGDTIEARRAHRMAVLKKYGGIWADRTDIPADGLEYQRQLRSE